MFCQDVSGFLERIDPFVNLYGRSSHVDQILDNALSEFEDLQLRPNSGIPPTIPQQGHQSQYASRHVVDSRSSTKKKYKCTQCGHYGHTKRNCPLNNMKWNYKKIKMEFKKL